MKILDEYLNYLDEGYFLIAGMKAAQDYQKKLKKEKLKAAKEMMNKQKETNEGFVKTHAAVGAASFVNYQKVRRNCELGCRRLLKSKPIYINCVKTCKRKGLNHGR